MPNYPDDIEQHNQRLIAVQKQCAQYLMSAISKLPWTKDSVVAGGAPRDWFMGKPATDIDIFLIDTTINQGQLIEHMEQAGFGRLKFAGRKPCKYKDPNGEATYYTNPKIKVVYDGVTSFRPSIDAGAFAVKFQVVVTFCKSVAELLETFPVEISKFTWNHLTGRITGEPGALADVQNKTLTQTTHDVTQGRYIRKIAAKFPDHMCLDKTNTQAIVKKVLPPSPTEEQVKAILKQYPDKLNQPLDMKAGKVRLEADMFAYWLQGFFEMTGATSIDERQTQIIKDHLALVFNKVTPDRSQRPQPVSTYVCVDGMTCNNGEGTVYDGISLFRGHARVVPPTAILPAKTLVSC